MQTLTQVGQMMMERVTFVAPYIDCLEYQVKNIFFLMNCRIMFYVILPFLTR